MKDNKKLPRAFGKAYPQVGLTNIPVDKSRIAMKSGWRMSKNDRKYMETRKNRSDVVLTRI